MRLALSRLLLLLVLPAALPAAAADQPRLVVVITVDQLRGDHLARFGPHFGPGGFRRLLEGGLDFRDTHYRHAFTLTGPGHATLATGVHADVHGVIANDWLDRGTWEMINAVEDPQSPLVGVAPGELGPAAAARPEKTGRSPRNLLAPGVADRLKERYGADSRVITLSNKDRSAILLGGQRADGAYWDEVGRMVTSRHYAARLPEWVEAFNAEQRVHAAFGKTWERLLPAAVYEQVQGPDDQAGENEGMGLGRTFPKRVDGGAKAVGPAFFGAFDNTPFATEVLGEFAQRAIRAERLGHHPGVDFLGVSFSQVDAVGHAYGPDSHELMDSMLRLDRVLAGLLDCLDREVGLGRCLIVLSADHGVAPLPEQAARREPGAQGSRANSRDIDGAVRQALDAAFGAPPKTETWFVRDGTAYQLRPAALEARKVTAEAAAKVVRDALRARPEVVAAFTAAELAAAPADGNDLAAQFRRSQHTGRSRDVLYAYRPHVGARAGTGTGHGSPHPYDTHVANVWFGAGIKPGVRTERVGVDAIAPTLIARLGLAPLPDARAKPLF